MNEVTYLNHDEVITQRPWRTVTRWLIVANVLVFVLDYFVIRRPLTLMIQGQPAFTEPLLAFYGHFSVFFAIFHYQFWRFFTYQFVHANIEHILLNMMGLFMAGPLVEAAMGRVRFLVFYLICGAMGPIAHIGLSQLHILDLNAFTPLVGASASIYGVLVAAARIAPDAEVMLVFPPIDMKLRNFVLLIIGLSLAAVLWRWQNAGGHAAHLGGAVAGWILARRMIRPEQAVMSEPPGFTRA
ncbi:MAG: rhomboid family intramembrane serine protease [Tepidisphaeraceae bacterium]